MKNNWQKKKLGDVCKIEKGKNPILQDSYQDGFLVYLSANYLRGGEHAKYAAISDKKSVPVSSHEIIIICDGSNSGETFCGFKGVLCSTMGKIASSETVDKAFLKLALEMALEDFKKRKTGTAIPHLDIKALYEREIFLPPFSEQQRIVAILDKALAGIEKAKENTKRNLQNAKELFESYSQEVFKNCENSINKTLGEVCNLYQGVAINAKTRHVLVEKSELPLLRIKDLKNNTVEQYIDPNNFPKNALVNESDLIYTRTGQIGLVFTGKRGVLHNNSFKIVPSEILSRDYLFHWLQNPIFKSKIISLASRAAQPDITHSLFKQQVISIPSLPIQQTIVKDINNLSRHIKKLEKIYQQKLLDLEELKKAALKQAFSGEL